MQNKKYHNIALEGIETWKSGVFPNEQLEKITSPDDRKQAHSMIFAIEDGPNLDKKILFNTQRAFRNSMSMFSRFMGTSYLITIIGLVYLLSSFFYMNSNEIQGLFSVMQGAIALGLAYQRKYIMENVQIVLILMCSTCIIEFGIFGFPDVLFTQISDGSIAMHDRNSRGMSGQGTLITILNSWTPYIYAGLKGIWMITLGVSIVRRKTFLSLKSQLETSKG